PLPRRRGLLHRNGRRDHPDPRGRRPPRRGRSSRPGHERAPGRILLRPEGRGSPVRRLADVRERLRRTPVAETDTDTETEATYRLPRTVTPSRYDLTLRVDLDAGTFRGSEDVAVTVHEPVTEVVVNAKELTVHGGSLAADGRSVPIEKVVADAEAE